LTGDHRSIDLLRSEQLKQKRRVRQSFWVIAMREDLRREDSDWVCVHCGRRFFRENDARVHVFTKHRKKTGKADKGAHVRH